MANQPEPSERTAAIQTAVDHLIDQHFADALGDADSSDFVELSDAAVHEVLAITNPRMLEQDKALSTAFDAEWNALWMDMRHTAFLIGMAYGRRLAGGAR